MTNVAVIGSQWGDEVKSKIVDWLSERADLVVRFQGAIMPVTHWLLMGWSINYLFCHLGLCARGKFR